MGSSSVVSAARSVAPAVTSVAGAFSSAAGAAASAAGVRAQSMYTAALGKLNEAMAQSDASLLELNASISEQQARMAIQVGHREEQQLRLQSAQIEGKQRVGFAASGVDLGVGSAARVLATTDYMTEVDAYEIRANAARAAFGYKVQATNQKFAALSARSQGMTYAAGSAFASAGAAGISPLASAAGSLLSSASRIGPQVYGAGKSAGWWS